MSRDPRTPLPTERNHDHEEDSMLRKMGRTATTCVGLGLIGAMPLAALHPGHDHTGLLGGAFHVVLQTGGGLLLLSLIAVALFARRRPTR